MDRNKSSTASGMGQGVNGKSVGIITSGEHWKSEGRSGHREPSKRQNGGATSGKNAKLNKMHQQNYQQATGTSIKFTGLGPTELNNNTHIANTTQQKGAALPFGQRQLNYMTSYQSSNPSNQ